MNTATHRRSEVFLMPGEIWFGGGDVRLRTTLGACVAITFWHPIRHIGGMCHFLLADALAGHDAVYGVEAVQLLIEAMAGEHSAASEYHANLFSGGRMFASAARRAQDDNVLRRNIELAKQVIRGCGTRIKGEHLGNNGHRQLLFDIGDGEIWLREWPLVEGVGQPLRRALS